MAAIVLVLAGVLGAFTVGAYRTATTTQAIRTDVEAVIANEPYSELALLAVRT